MTLLRLKMLPGVNTSESEYSQKGRWIDAQWVRFFNGRPEKMGGWQKLLDTAFVGKCRGLHAWRDDGENRRIAIGTHKKLYYYYAGAFTDITPIRATASLTDPFDTTSGSAVVTVTDADHGATAGSYVTFSDATAVGGLTIDGEYAVTEVLSTSTYTITHSAAATSTANGGGSVSAAYQINIGLEDSINAFGYGVGTYGSGTYGTARTTSFVTLNARTWMLDNRGENLIACHRNGTIYEWDPDTGGRATAVTNAPTDNAGAFVAETQQIVAFGAGGSRMAVQFSDDDDHTDWSASSADTAGGQTLNDGSELIAGGRGRDRTNLLWSDTALFQMQYTGEDFVYTFNKVASSCGIFGPHAWAEFLGRFYWMHGDDFLVFDGTSVQPIPNSADIRDFVFSDLNREQRAKCWARANAKFSEIWFFYCSADSDEVDRYVVVSTADWSWTVGSLARTAGIDHGLFDDPIWAGDDLYLYKHESGVDAVAAAIQAYVKSAPMEIAEGEYLMDIMGIIPDFDDLEGVLDIALYTKRYPNGQETAEDTYSVSDATERVDTRASGRSVAIRYESNEVGGHFRAGDVRLDVKPAGRRR